jgi:precorrin-6A/cobalt-precorrin-6A reductase
MILILAGTFEGREVIERLIDEGFTLLASTATEAGKELIPRHKRLETIAGRLDREGLEEIIMKRGITCIVDASHPYAVKASENAIRASGHLSIPYLRYERPGGSYGQARRFKSPLDAAQWLQGESGRVMLTTGATSIDTFVEKVGRERIVARVLPLSSSIRKCEELGLLPPQILALQGPFSVEINRALYRHFDISYVVMKDSGLPGGTPEKLEAARLEGIEVLMIERPQIHYPCICTGIDDVAGAVNALMQGQKG